MCQTGHQPQNQCIQEAISMNLFRSGAFENARRTSKCDCALCEHLTQKI